MIKKRYEIFIIADRVSDIPSCAFYRWSLLAEINLWMSILWMFWIKNSHCWKIVKTIMSYAYLSSFPSSSLLKCISFYGETSPTVETNAFYPVPTISVIRDISRHNIWRFEYLPMPTLTPTESNTFTQSKQKAFCYAAGFLNDCSDFDCCILSY